jgi:hypothetical protein
MIDNGKNDDISTPGSHPIKMSIHMRKLIPSLYMICILAVSCTQNEVADLILMNGKVYTLEADQPWASAVVIRENKIISVLNNDRAARKYSGPATRVVDLEGKFVVPGFIDGHTHFDGTGDPAGGSPSFQATECDRRGESIPYIR